MTPPMGQGRQLLLFSDFQNNQNQGRRLSHGGSFSIGRRKRARPLSRRCWIHLVFKSHRARGAWNLLSARSKGIIHQVLKEKSRIYGVKIKDFANVGNHLHLKIKIHDRENFQNFLRVAAGLIARKIMRAEKACPQGTFWEFLAFTNILKTSLEEWRLRIYFQANRIEATHGKKAREDFLKIQRQKIPTPRSYLRKRRLNPKNDCGVKS